MCFPMMKSEYARWHLVSSLLLHHHLLPPFLSLLPLMNYVPVRSEGMLFLFSGIYSSFSFFF